MESGNAIGSSHDGRLVLDRWIESGKAVEDAIVFDWKC